LWHVVRGRRCARRTLAALAALAMVMLAMVAAPGCMQEERNRQEMMHQRIVTLNRADVMVMTGDLPEAHQTLGEIKYSEPFSGAAIETDHINAKLRTLAI